MSPCDSPPPPEDEKIRYYSYFYCAYDKLTPAPVRRTIQYLLGIISPTIPADLSADLVGASAVAAGLTAALMTFLFSFVGTVGLTYWNGTLSGIDPSRMYFSQDVYNIILYALVCPCYVGLGAALVTAVVQGYGKIQALACSVSSNVTTKFQIHIPLGIFIILSLSALFICKYALAVSDIDRVGKVYWFIEQSPKGDLRLGFVFFYYILLNFCLLVATLTFLGCFCSMFLVSISVGDALSYAELSDLEFESIRLKMGTFVTVYICAKLLIVAYMINFYIWSASPLAVAQENVLATKVALTIFGIFFISLPRYYIEYQWHLFKWRTPGLRAAISQHDDLRTRRVRTLAFFADTTLIGTFVASVWLEPILRNWF